MLRICIQILITIVIVSIKYCDSSKFHYRPALVYIYLKVHVYIHTYIPSTTLFVFYIGHLFQTWYESIYPSVCLSMNLSIHLSVCPSIYPFVCLSINLSIHPSIHPNLSLSYPGCCTISLSVLTASSLLIFSKPTLLTRINISPDSILPSAATAPL